MNGHVQADQETFDAVGAKLRQGAEHLAGAEKPPLPIEAGRVSGVLAALGAHLASESETLTGQLGGAADTVTSAARSFAEIDQEAVRAITPVEKEIRVPQEPGPQGGMPGTMQPY